MLPGLKLLNEYVVEAEFPESVDVAGFAETRWHPGLESSPRTAVEVSPQQNCRFAEALLEFVLPEPFRVAAVPDTEVAELVEALKYLSELSFVQNCFISP